MGMLSACAIVKGLLALFVALGVLDGTGGTYNILFSLSDSLFYYFPIILGYTAAKKFGISEFEGLVIGATMVYPNMLGGNGLDISDLFGIPVVMPASGNYASSVIPVIFAVVFAAWFEKKYKKWIPDTIKMFTVPLITCFVTLCLTFWAIGPVASAASDLIGTVFMTIYQFSPVVMGVVVGGFWQILVIFRLHWAITPIMINNVQTLGFDTVMIGMFCASFAQTGVIIAIYLKTKNKQLKSLCVPAIVSGFAGVTEPAIYGITLPKKKPFAMTCVVSAVTGGILAALGAKYFVVPGMGIAVYSPLSGKVITLSEVKDEAFSSGALGQGVAVVPNEGKLYAPVDGVIAAFFPTGHAVGIQTEDGMEILIHVGMDTVSLDGKGFEKRVNQGDAVKKGDLILEFNLRVIEEAGLSAFTPVIVTNPGERALRRAETKGVDSLGIRPAQETDVMPGDILFTMD